MTQWLEGLAARRADMGRSSTAGRVADALREDVIEGRLLPGVRLSEEDIGAALGISRNTLREAFRLLTHERLLVHEFNRGVFVRRLTTEDVRDLYRVRRALEAAALRAAPGAPPERLEAVRRAVEDGERAAVAGDWTLVGSANMHFHQALAGLLDSPRLDETMRQLLAELRLVFHVMADPRAFHEPYLQGNREILRLLEEGDTAAAERALAHYFDVAEKQLLDAMG
ncbi:GntR family transcriptional regulator [Nocardioides panaciterrulae]|uniref:DNA-binding GntR family transcriptional regulator n=1 Tax=Nocardioides panaciterrulae TaxID=661492 RepID=A0A7Y9E514_9ACTN|nr:GntR family transcriptional regulator [Nocardioides panaciterrulae]NYD41112.1 DNA-binding GntR family transcriptional regulator [Nocardioides panaciterrulae]